MSKTPLLDSAKRKFAELFPKANVPAVDFDAATGEIWLDGEIGNSSDEINSKDVRQALSKIGSQRLVTVHINSPGGSVSEGFATFELLAKHPGGVTTMASFAASMASLLFQVGKVRTLEKTSTLMIHSPWTRTSGNAAELTKSAEILRKFEVQMTKIYVARTGKTSTEIEAMLAEEIWLNATEAVAMGFADSIVGSDATQFPKREVARLALQALKPKVFPKRERARVAAMVCEFE